MNEQTNKQGSGESTLHFMDNCATLEGHTCIRSLKTRRETKEVILKLALR